MIDGVVYKAVNRVNGKIYVGQTIGTLEKRILKHLSLVDRGSYRSPCFYVAIRKYSAENFIWKIIDHARTKKALNRKEIFWIKELGSKAPNGYNSTDGGEGNLGFYPSKETREKLSKNNPMKHPEIATKRGAKTRGENHPMFGRRRKDAGHWKGGKKVKDGCLIILKWDHPRADHRGYVCAHFLEWEKYHGPIPKGKQVHFKDRSLKITDEYGRRYRDPSIENLYIPGYEEGGNSNE